MDELSSKDYIDSLLKDDSPAESSPPQGSQPTIAGGDEVQNAAAQKPDPTTAPNPPDNADTPWADVAGQAVKALPSSAEKFGKGIFNTFRHPLNTAEAIGSIGSGLVSKAEGALGENQDPTEKASREALVNAIGKHYSDVYGGLSSGDTSGLKKELSTDPLSPLIDLATVVTGGGGLLAKAPGMLGKVGELAGNLGSKIDPIQNAVKLAKIAASPVTYPVKKIVPYMQAASTGVPKNLLDVAGKAGATSDPTLKEAFLGAANGTVTPDQTVGKVRSALDDIQSENSKAYWEGKSKLGDKPLSWQPVTDALAKARTITRKTDASGQTMIVDPKGDSILDDIEKEINGDPENGVKGLMNADPGSTFHTAEGFDALKQKVGHLVYDRQVSGKTKAAVSGIYNGIKQSITDVYPDYQKLMEDSQQRMMEAKDLLSQAGNSNIPITKQFAKIQLSTRKGNDTLLNAVSQKDPTIPYLLAGHAISDWMPNRLRQAIQTPAALFAAIHSPLALAPAAAATSPRIMGMTNYALGKLSKGKLGAAKGNLLEQANKLQTPIPPMVPQTSMPKMPTGGVTAENDPTPIQGSIYAKGGRIQRRSGGAVNAEVSRRANELIQLAEKIKKGENAKTSSLLKMDDSTIAKALAIANQHI